MSVDQRDDPRLSLLELIRAAQLKDTPEDRESLRNIVFKFLSVRGAPPHDVRIDETAPLKFSVYLRGSIRGPIPVKNG